MSFLKKIMPAKRAEVARLKSAFARTPASRPAHLPVRSFEKALRGGNRLIAEIKKKSPSHPEFHQAASCTTLARAYQRNGAAALSIVTDTEHFGTSLADVPQVKAAVSLPVLVKDFVIDESQLLAAWAAGADAVLLIVRMLDRSRLATLLAFAHQLGLQVLVECHDQADIDRAVAAEGRIIGVNNRNLATLTTHLDHGAAMMPHVPRPAVRVSESGLYCRADILGMAALGADAFLVGHALLQSPDPGRKVAELCGREPENSPRVKICGLTSVQDARMAHEAGADILGVIFAAGARQITGDEAREIRDALPEARLCGVFLDQSPAEIKRTTDLCDLDLIQLHGNESPALCREIQAATGRPIIKALAADQASGQQVEKYDAVAYFLVDLPKTGGGDPDACLAAAEDLSALGHEVLLAGGLNPDNIRTIRSRLRPFAFDVASGVESQPRHKDIDKTRQFIAEVKR